MKRFLFVAALSAACLASLRSASAGPLVQGLNQIFFQNVESLHDGQTGEFKPLGATIEVDDVFVGIFNVQNIDVGGQTEFFQSPNEQLSGIFAHRVVAVNGPPDPFDANQTTFPHITLAPVLDTQFSFTGIDGTTIDLRGGDGVFGTADDLLNPTTGEMFRLWHDTGATQYETNGTFAQDVSVATDGDLLFSYGYGPGPDGEFGTNPANAADDTGYVYSHAPGVVPTDNLVGEGFVGLDFIIDNSGLLFGLLNDDSEGEVGDIPPGKLNQIIGQFEIELNPEFLDDNSPWSFLSNDPFLVQVVIPEPSSVALFGIATACMAVGTVVRRRKQRSVEA